MKIPFGNNPQVKSRLHIVIGSLIFLTLVLTIARLALKGTPSSRANTWGIAVCLKAAVFLSYQVLTARVERLKQWASLKANMILDIIDTVFWFALVIITIMATAGSHSTGSQALGVIIAMLAFALFGFVGLLSLICIRDHRYYKVHGRLPGMT
ncbi:hypothetical protein N7499_003255 [Penicillium canescens]|uniref:MARVEL domain-containing protein n=1 Tax=Penicillium canescens TaxID=5083 RepID=A0AAD6I5G0_PENCN|nr:uncharacterized protein N7446_014017 [Penicillium canescens]KAJ6018550.1 hypothetical protein N7522_002014 [Penicillium canescens]KAJ6034156.1 hypothetical protein N7460_009973 [Penicillium canescens]KAJ6039269.1 hypothetical protein N7446_014017 [Penicillium canescens]KAJ6066118.1 hypothetical protein N7444_000247 [Penicillium canescens]KAJ6091104.1 hypothetical protein N7499_003255 [Penicillium canescens]